MKMIDSIQVNYFFILVIHFLLIHQVHSTNSTELENKNELILNNNEIGDNSLLDKYELSKELKYYLRAFIEDNLKNQFNNQTRSNLNESSIVKISSSSNQTELNHLNSTNRTELNDLNSTNRTLLNYLNSTNRAVLNDLNSTNRIDVETNIKSDLRTELKTNKSSELDLSSNVTTLDTEHNDQNDSRSAINDTQITTTQSTLLKNQEDKYIEKHLFKSMCSMTNNQVKGCERYECNKNTCYCNRAFDLTLNLKPIWPIKYMCLNRTNYNEECLVDEQCSGKHQVCLNKKNFRNYLNYDLDFSSLNDQLEQLIKTTANNTSNLDKQIFIQQMLTLYDQTKLTEFTGKCRCKLGYFYNYYLSYSKNKHFSKQFNSFLIESNSTNISDLFAKQKNLFIGHCLKVRSLNETCELNSECQMNDPSSVCRRRKCVCKTGFQIEIRNQKASNELAANELATNQSNSILINKLTNTSINETATRLICEPILNLNLELGHPHNRIVEMQVLKNNSSNYQQFNRNSNVQMIKNLLIKNNCTDELIICEGGRHNCIKKSKRLHVQENFASLVWTVLCMLSIILVLCMLLIKNKQDDNLELNHNYNNYFLRNTSVSNLNQQATSFLGSMFNRSHLNSSNATELQNINERSLISCSPPPYEQTDDPPSYTEALLMQQKPQ